jgi:hypothetical protein
LLLGLAGAWRSYQSKATFWHDGQRLPLPPFVSPAQFEATPASVGGPPADPPAVYIFRTEDHEHVDSRSLESSLAEIAQRLKRGKE